MICPDCAEQFFAPARWSKLEKGDQITIDLQRAINIVESSSFCTICSAVLQEVATALSSHLSKTYEVDKEHWKEVASKIDGTLPGFPARIEKRIGRYSLIVGPCYDAEFRVKDRKEVKFDLDLILFILSPRASDEEENEAQDHNRRLLGRSTDSDESMDQAKAWLAACTSPQEHPECVSIMANQHRKAGAYDPENVFMPTRLLDVGDQNSPTFRLVLTKDDQIQSSYTTLSHMWGIPSGERFSLEPSNFSNFRNGIPLSDPRLPKTFLHAMQVTRRLGIQYLWVDSMCIIQDGKDFTSESKIMEEIYRESYCNIAATSSSNGTQGLYRERNPDHLPPDIVRFKHKRYALVHPYFWEQQLLHEPLYARGWVLQERILTGRILHFAESQLFFQCPSQTACESSPTSLPVGIRGEKAKLELKFRRALHHKRESDMGAADLYTAWKDVVEGYTSCDLSYDSDKFIALQGTTTVFSRAMGSKFIAGLWDTVAEGGKDRESANIPDQLGWMVDEGANVHGKPSFRYREYRAPSWSWGCLEGVIKLKDRLDYRPQAKVYTVDILECLVRVKEPELPCGAVMREGTQMKVRGKLVDITLVRWREKWNTWAVHWGTQETETDDADEGENNKCRAYLDAFGDAEQLRKKESHAVDTRASRMLLLRCYLTDSKSYSGHGLLLNELRQDPLHCSRLGVVELVEMSDEQWTQLWESGIERDVILL